MLFDVGHGFTCQLIRAPGGWVAKIYKDGSHRATVSTPGQTTRTQALDQAKEWAKTHHGLRLT